MSTNDAPNGSIIFIYVDYNYTKNTLPKLWAGNPEGDLFFGSFHKSLTYQSKDSEYFDKTSKKKLRDGYVDLGFYKTSILEDLSPLVALFAGNAKQSDVNLVKADKGLIKLANAFVNSDPNGSITRTLKQSLNQHGLHVGSQFDATQSAPPSVNKPILKNVNVLNDSSDSLKSDSAWSW